MRIKRITATVLTALMLISAVPSVTAAAPGSPDDPLLSLSYIRSKYLGTFMSRARTEAAEKLYPVRSRVNELTITAAGFRTLTVEPDGAAIIKTGGSIVSGTGGEVMETTYGNIVNLSTGEELSGSFELSAGNRYMVAENSIAAVRLPEGGTLFADGPVVKDGGDPGNVWFSDVQPGAWEYGYVETMAALGVVKGGGGGKFNPADSMTRADFVTVIGRLYGVDTTLYNFSSFPDIDVTSYYSPYVSWASMSDIVKGTQTGEFNPLGKITRAEMAAIIVRFAAYAGITLPGADGERFADDASIANWAKVDAYIARNAGYILGKTGNLFDSAGNASRAEVCTVLYRLIRPIQN